MHCVVIPRSLSSISGTSGAGTESSDYLVFRIDRFSAAWLVRIEESPRSIALESRKETLIVQLAIEDCVAISFHRDAITAWIGGDPALSIHP